MDLEEIRARVRTVWAEVAPEADFDETLTWSEAGVDSLKSLQLLVRLEEDLGRPLSFELFTPEMTLGALMEALRKGPATAGASARAGRAPVYLVPGIFGDEPRLAAFRKAARGELDLRVLRLPDLEAPASTLADLSRTARFLADQIPTEGGGEPFALAGYSFGAFLALELADVLLQEARAPLRLFLIDPLPGALSPSAPGGIGDLERARAGLWEGRSLLSRGKTFVVKRLMRIGAFELARRFARAAASRRDFGGDHLRRVLVLEPLRQRALRGWSPAAFEGPGVLFMSEDFGRAGDAQALFARAPKLRRVALPAGHFEVFDGAAGRRLREALAEELRSGRPD